MPSNTKVVLSDGIQTLEESAFKGCVGLVELTLSSSLKSLEYVLVGEDGPAHDKTFVFEVKIDNIVYGRGIGKSKKEAEQNAALDAYKKSVK